MQASIPIASSPAEIRLDRAALIAEAYSRTLGKKEIRRVIEEGGSVRVEVEKCLGMALDCIHALCKPAGFTLDVNAEKAECGVLLNGRVFINNAKLRDELTVGAQVSVYSLTCGYDSREALKWLDGDYTVYHFQNMLGRELLFAIGRQLFANLGNEFPLRHFSRYSIRVRDGSLCDGVSESKYPAPNYWDARAVLSLLDLFVSNELGVTATDSRCLSPVHSLLGVMMSVPLESELG